MELLVLQPDGTVREGTLEDWKEHVKQLEEQIKNLKEILDIEQELRLRRK